MASSCLAKIGGTVKSGSGVGDDGVSSGCKGNAALARSSIHRAKQSNKKYPDLSSSRQELDKHLGALGF